MCRGRTLALLAAAVLALAAGIALAGCVVTVLEPEAPQPEPAAPATMTPFPTPAEVAPAHTFTEVGNVGLLEGSHGVTGKGVVAGLQTLIIQGFTFDGKGPAADVRLVMGSDYASPAAVLGVLESRVYDGEMLLYIIPSTVTPENADRLVIYAPETGEVYAETTFH